MSLSLEVLDVIFCVDSDDMDVSLINQKGSIIQDIIFYMDRFSMNDNQN